MPTNKFQVRLLPIAEEDFTEIITYIASDNISAANKVADKIENDLGLLSNNPLMGRIPKDVDLKNFGYRYIIVQNYIIFYTIEEKNIFIHRILHGARNYKELM